MSGSSSVKYKSPTSKDIYAKAMVSDEEKEKFGLMFAKKRRGSIEVKVEVRDSAEVLTMLGSFVWFIQKVENRL